MSWFFVMIMIIRIGVYLGVDEFRVILIMCKLWNKKIFMVIV